MKFSIVIPTYNREKDLVNCLNSILRQMILPFEVIIIDDGNLSYQLISGIKKDFLLKNINLVYYKKNHAIERRGLSESKNKSLELVQSNIFFIFDDDVVLEPNFCEEIMDIWSKEKDDKNLIGVGGIIKNRRKRYKFEKYYNIIFGLSSKYSWDVNNVGFQIWDEEVKNPTLGYYAHGGVCSYNLSKVKELKFSTFSGGRTALEDVDFCLRSKNKGYHFIIEPMAQLYHYPSVVSREGLYMMGYKEGFNRRLIFKSIFKKSNLFLNIQFFWASFGWILRQFLVGNFKKGMGILYGTFFV